MTESHFQYSSQASRVMQWAQAEAKRLEHPEVVPEHMLLGIIEEERGLARFVLRSLGVNMEILKGEVRAAIADLPGDPVEIPPFSEGARKILELGMQSAGVLERPYLGTEHLLIGLLRDISSRSYSILRRADVTYARVLEKVRNMPTEGIVRADSSQDSNRAGVKPGDRLTIFKILAMVSPVFWLLLLATVFFGMQAYHGGMDEKAAVFLFVTGGWILSVSLHEFGHALIAYLGGDHSVLNKGYLSLNPLRYTHGFLSVVLPLLFLAMGGIGLPGGVVYINTAAIKKRSTISLMSAAGPIVSAGCALLLSLPFIFGMNPLNSGQHIVFWSGLAFLAFLQVTAVLFNLLPIPGLDGYGILRPYLPAKLVKQIGSFGSLTFILIYLLFFNDSVVQEYFWLMVQSSLSFLKISIDLAMQGLFLYRFW